MSNTKDTDKKAESAASSARPSKAADDRQARLSKALRDNLRRRKSQVRARKAQDKAQDKAEANKQETASGQTNPAAQTDQT